MSLCLGSSSILTKDQDNCSKIHYTPLPINLYTRIRQLTDFMSVGWCTLFITSLCHRLHSNSSSRESTHNRHRRDDSRSSSCCPSISAAGACYAAECTHSACHAVPTICCWCKCGTSMAVLHAMNAWDMIVLST